MMENYYKISLTPKIQFTQSIGHIKTFTQGEISFFVLEILPFHTDHHTIIFDNMCSSERNARNNYYQSEMTAILRLNLGAYTVECQGKLKNLPLSDSRVSQDTYISSSWYHIPAAHPLKEKIYIGEGGCNTCTGNISFRKLLSIVLSKHAYLTVLVEITIISSRLKNIAAHRCILCLLVISNVFIFFKFVTQVAKKHTASESTHWIQMCARTFPGVIAARAFYSFS